jgi:hypothetical protein
MVEKKNAPESVPGTNEGINTNDDINNNTERCDPATMVEILSLARIINAHRGEFNCWVQIQIIPREDMVTIFSSDYSDAKFKEYSTNPSVTWLFGKDGIYDPGLFIARNELERRINTWRHCTN